MHPCVCQFRDVKSRERLFGPKVENGQNGVLTWAPDVNAHVAYSLHRLLAGAELSDPVVVTYRTTRHQQPGTKLPLCHPRR